MEAVLPRARRRRCQRSPARGAGGLGHRSRKTPGIPWTVLPWSGSSFRARSASEIPGLPASGGDPHLRSGREALHPAPRPWRPWLHLHRRAATGRPPSDAHLREPFSCRMRFRAPAVGPLPGHRDRRARAESLRGLPGLLGSGPGRRPARCFSTGPPGGEPEDPRVRGYPDEKQMLAELRRRIIECDPDVITGWNVVDFDLRVLTRRFSALGVPFDIGRSDEQASFLDREDSDGITRWKRNKAIVPGRCQVLDGLWLVRICRHGAGRLPAGNGGAERPGEGAENRRKAGNPAQPRWSGCTGRSRSTSACTAWRTPGRCSTS